MDFRTVLAKPVQLASDFAKAAKQETTAYLRGHVEDIAVVIHAAPSFTKAAIGGVSTLTLSVMEIGAVAMAVETHGAVYPMVASVSLSLAIYDSFKRTKRNWRDGIARMDEKFDSFFDNPFKGPGL